MAKKKTKKASKKASKKQAQEDPTEEPQKESKISSLTKRAAKIRSDLSRRTRDMAFGTVEDTDQFGSKNKALFVFAKILHMIDLILGAACIAYGVTLYIDGNLTDYGIDFIIFGALLVLSSLLGYAGFASSAAKRSGLLLSSYLGFIIGACELVAAISLSSYSSDFFDFLQKNHRDLDLTQEDVDSLENYFFFIKVGIGMIGVAELLRCYALRTLRKDLISIESVVSARNNASSEPLLDNEEGDDESDSDSDFAPVDGQLYTDGNWWADKNQFEEIARKENLISSNQSTKSESVGGDIV